MLRLGGYGILPYPRRHQTIFPQNPTQPNHLCASVRICGRLFSTRNFCEFREFRGRSLRNLTICGHLCASVGGSSPPEASVNSVNSVGEPYAAKPSVSIGEICGRLFSTRSFCVFRGFRGRITMLVHECSVGAAETAAHPGRAAWVGQGCHTLLR